MTTGVAWPKKVKQSVRRADDISQTTEQVRQALLRFRKAVGRQVKLMENGTRAVEALESVNASDIRRELAEAMTEFDALRHQSASPSSPWRWRRVPA